MRFPDERNLPLLLLTTINREDSLIFTNLELNAHEITLKCVRVTGRTFARDI
jgi:hypothetical protein